MSVFGEVRAENMPEMPKKVPGTPDALVVRCRAQTRLLEKFYLLQWLSDLWRKDTKLQIQMLAKKLIFY